MRFRNAIFTIVLLLATGFWQFAAQAAPIEIQFWHAMTGKNNEYTLKLVDGFNASQDKFKIVPVGHSNYLENLTLGVAAVRAGKQPHILQVYEVGTQTMMFSGAIVPVEEMMKEQGYNIDWNGFLGPVVGYYQASDGKLMSMPFNSSSPLFYYNKDQLEKAGISGPPVTWQELAADAKKLQASGQKCALTIGWQFWTQIENYSALHNIPFATENNGYDGLSARLVANNPRLVQHIALLEQMAKDGSFSYEGRTQTGAVPAFTSGKCSMTFNSTGDYANTAAQAKFNWAAAPMPVEEGSPVYNSIIGGATLWVLSGHPKEDYAGVAAFFNYLAQTPSQVLWHEGTGYLPITLAAYEAAKKEGFYEKSPGLEIAIKQLTRTKPTKVSRGVRLGNLSQINIVFDEELENVWAGKKTAQQAMIDADRRSNVILSEFEQLNSKK